MFNESEECLPKITKLNLSLSRGIHNIEAKSEGITPLKRIFEINNTRYASLLYFYHPSYWERGGVVKNEIFDDSGFYFNIFDEPIIYE